MQIFYDFLPVIAFFVAYKLYDIYVATAVIIVSVGIQVLLYWLITHKVSRMHLTSAVLVLIFGGITLALRNELFIQWKPTIVNWLFGLAFLASQFIGEKPIIQRMMEQSIDLDGDTYRKLNLIWASYFFFMGVANLFVVYNFSEEAWVNFKLFGMLGLTIVFFIIQGIWLARKLPAESVAETPAEKPPST